MASGHVSCTCWPEMTRLIFLAIDDAIAMLCCISMIIDAKLCLCHYDLRVKSCYSVIYLRQAYVCWNVS